MAIKKKFFIITIDTEGDNLWSKPDLVTTRNSNYLPRFQALCESLGLRPTYLVNYEMAECPVFREFGNSALEKDTAEIGMHLHAWNSPPIVPLTDDDNMHQPYLVEYPEEIMRDKINRITDILEDNFSMKMTSARSGRWAFNETYARLLNDRGYLVDCSVTPHVSWRRYPGDPRGNGGTDYDAFPEKSYFIDLDDISRKGDSNLLEVPVTIRIPPPWQNSLFSCFGKGSIPWKILNRLFTHERWLRPNGKNLNLMIGLLKQVMEEDTDYVQFMMHSPELMPGGSPTFPRKDGIEKLYSDLERLFKMAISQFTGCTFNEYYKTLVSNDKE